MLQNDVKISKHSQAAADSTIKVQKSHNLS